MYAAAAIHRLSQYFSARKDVADYPTLRAYRDAANHRTSMKETLRRIATKVVQLSRKESSSSVEEVQLPSPTGVFELSQIAEVDGELMDEDEEVVLGAASPEARAMPYAAGKTGKSPNARGKSVDYVNDEMKERCENSLGIFLTKLVHDPEGEKAETPIRRLCVLCKQRCNTWCTGCRRILCFIPPKDRKVRVRVKIKPRKPKGGKRA